MAAHVHCSCGLWFSKPGFDALPLVGLMATEIEGEWLVLRNCPCHSTICERLSSDRDWEKLTGVLQQSLSLDAA